MAQKYTFSRSLASDPVAALEELLVFVRHAIQAGRTISTFGIQTGNITITLNVALADDQDTHLGVTKG